MVPQFILEKVPAMLGCEAGLGSPFLDPADDEDMDSGVKKRRRRSVGGEGCFSNVTFSIEFNSASLV